MEDQKISTEVEGEDSDEALSNAEAYLDNLWTSIIDLRN